MSSIILVFLIFVLLSASLQDSDMIFYNWNNVYVNL